MASPHVAGAVALLWSAFPSLRGNVDHTEFILEQTALHLTTTQGCGGDTSSQVPNNVYGYGRIDVLAAYNYAAVERNGVWLPMILASRRTDALGGAAETWGRAWTAATLSNANFRVRVSDVASGSGAGSRDFSLDWVAVRVSYR